MRPIRNNDGAIIPRTYNEKRLLMASASDRQETYSDEHQDHEPKIHLLSRLFGGGFLFRRVTTTVITVDIIKEENELLKTVTGDIMEGIARIKRSPEDGYKTKKIIIYETVPKSQGKGNGLNEEYYDDSSSASSSSQDDSDDGKRISLLYTNKPILNTL